MTRRGRRGLLVACVVGLLPAAVGAQTLTVQPRTMATGTQNPAAGVYPLTADSGLIVSVPPSCVGAKRCPLLVSLGAGGQSAANITTWMRPVEDRHGLIVLAVSQDVVSQGESADAIDAALKETLQRFAIDPAKIAITGHCATGAIGQTLGLRNPHVFSRVGLVDSPFADDLTIEPQDTTVELLVEIGYEAVLNLFPGVRKLRQSGRPVRFVTALRGHEFQAEDYDFFGRWLEESWITPPASRPPPRVIEPLPLLTTDALKRMTAFWTRFFQLPDSIWRTGRLPYMRDVALPLKPEALVVPLTDMTALAAKYPPVAAALQQAGLTGQEHDAYRLALLTAILIRDREKYRSGWEGWGPLLLELPEPTSVLGKNVAFAEAHVDELQTLADAGVRDPSKMVIRGGDALPPVIAADGPLGI